MGDGYASWLFDACWKVCNDGYFKIGRVERVGVALESF
jgi:hypothetical protein